jgi:hypothetical protein
MITQSAQSMSFSGNTASEDSIILKTPFLYTGLRMTMSQTAGATVGAKILSNIESIDIDVPEYGAQSRRISLSGNSVKLLPLICQIGNSGQADATAATSVNAMDASDSVAGFAYFDLPINKRSLEQDVRITIKAKGGAETDDVIAFHFGFCDTPFRNVYFRSYDVPAAATNYQNWFPSDGTLQGAIVATHDGTGAITARNNSDIREISLDGERLLTFNNIQLLSAGLDEVISGGAQAAYHAKNVYAMMRNFGAKPGARYLSIDRSASVDLFVLGVMSDA